MKDAFAEDDQLVHTGFGDKSLDRICVSKQIRHITPISKKIYKLNYLCSETSQVPSQR
jgi:hypothetical protein